MTAHKCLTCTGEIKPGQDEEKITGKTSMLYLHAHYQDCQAELAGPSATAAALRSYRIRQDDGLVRRHQSVRQSGNAGQGPNPLVDERASVPRDQQPSPVARAPARGNPERRKGKR